MSPHRHSLRWFVSVLILPFMLPGCAWGPSTPDQPTRVMAYYLDANLGLALEHPQHWARQKRIVSPDPDAQLTVRWQPPRRWGKAPELEMTLVSLPPNRAVGGFPTLLQRYRERHPEVIEDHQVETVVAGLPGLRLEGKTTDRRLLVYFVTSAQRAVILEFSASPLQFETNLPLFEEIAASLTILNPPTSRSSGASRSE